MTQLTRGLSFLFAFTLMLALFLSGCASTRAASVESTAQLASKPVYAPPCFRATDSQTTYNIAAGMLNCHSTSCGYPFTNAQPVLSRFQSKPGDPIQQTAECHCCLDASKIDGSGNVVKPPVTVPASVIVPVKP